MSKPKRSKSPNMPKFLNSLNFNWTEPYNDEAEVEGIWMFDAMTHPHPQWIPIMNQSNPHYYTTWGIQRLLDEWKINILKDIDPPHNVFIPTRPPYELNLYQDACRLETCYDLKAYRQALDNLIEFNSEQIGDQFLRVGQNLDHRYETIRAKVIEWRGRFDLMFE